MTAGRAARLRASLAVLLIAVAAQGCATLPSGASDPAEPDRFERVNRGVYRFNRGVDRKVVRPLARAYDRVVPPRVERRFRNFFTNLRAPVDITNHWLQGKFKPGFEGLGRFLLNTVAGGGFFDPAGKLGLERRPEDFGQTLATWGVPSGGYFVMPFFGPGSVRDWSAWRVDAGLDPSWHVDDTSERNALLGWRLVPARKQASVEGFETDAYLTEARVTEDSKADGKTLRAIEDALDEAGAQVIGLVRNEVRVTAPSPGRMVRAGDILVIEAEAEAQRVDRGMAA